MFDFSTVLGDTKEKYWQCHPHDTVWRRLSPSVSENATLARCHKARSKNIRTIPLKSDPVHYAYGRDGNEKARRGGRASLSRIAPTKLCFVFVDAVGFRIEEVFRTQRVFVDAVDRVDRGEFFALGLALCLFGRTGNVQLDVDFDFGM